ncbi:MAG: hypothetical protein ACE5GZ_14220, partial [Gammaproteobacteria bacterium]
MNCGHLNEDEENTLIRLALARTEKADVITSNLARYGYKYDYNSGKSAEECFRDVLLAVGYVELHLKLTQDLHLKLTH